MKSAVKFLVLSLVVASVSVYVTDAAPEKFTGSLRRAARGKGGGTSDCAKIEESLTHCNEDLRKCGATQCPTSSETCSESLAETKSQSEKCAMEYDRLSSEIDAEKKDCKERKDQIGKQSSNNISEQKKKFQKERSDVQRQIDDESDRISKQEADHAQKMKELSEVCQKRKEEAVVSETLCREMCKTIHCDVDYSKVTDVAFWLSGYSFDPKSINAATGHKCNNRRRRDTAQKAFGSEGLETSRFLGRVNRGKGGGSGCGEYPTQLSDCQSNLNKCQNKCQNKCPKCDTCFVELTDFKDKLTKCKEKMTNLDEPQIIKNKCNEEIGVIEAKANKSLEDERKSHEAELGELKKKLQEQKQLADEQASQNEKSIENQNEQCDKEVGEIESANGRNCLSDCEKYECETGVPPTNTCEDEFGNVSKNESREKGLRLWCLNNASDKTHCEVLNMAYCQKKPYFFSPFHDGLKC
eukprot:Nk52_evm1s2415 gene=Nk52_evmTU1s2415